MATSPAHILLVAVRGRLWRGQFVAAARRALWGSVGLLLLAVAVHLTARPVPAGAALVALAVLWIAMMAWAGWRRPTDSACALWADRHLEGASAFTTLLEVSRGTPRTPDVQALRWLEHWATERVPVGMRLLAERHEPAHLFRPLVSTAVCTALATLVLALPGRAPALPQPLAASAPSSNADRPASDAAPLPSAELVSEVANALRSAAAETAPERREAAGTLEAGPGKIGDGTGFPMAAAPGAAPPANAAMALESSPGTPIKTAPAVGTMPAAGSGSGRDAGDSRDARAEPGVSRMPKSTMPVQRIDLHAGRGSSERRADADQWATYDEESPAPGAAAMWSGPAPAAATPPPAIEAAQLTATEATYVRAWMKASGRNQ